MSWCKPNKNGSVHSEVKNSWKVTRVIKKHYPPGWYNHTISQTFPQGLEGEPVCLCLHRSAAHQDGDLRAGSLIHLQVQ